MCSRNSFLFYQYNLPFIQNKRDLDVLSSHIDEFIDHEYDDFNYDFTLNYPKNTLAWIPTLKMLS